MPSRSPLSPAHGSNMPPKETNGGRRRWKGNRPERFFTDPDPIDSKQEEDAWAEAWAEEPTRTRAKSSVETEGEFKGIIKCFYSNKGFGFIQSQETWDIWGVDVFLHQKQLETTGFNAGDYVKFAVILNKKKQPQAMNLRPTSPPPPPPLTEVWPELGAAGWLSEGEEVGEEENGPWFKGTIKFIDAEKGYGFISCPDAASYGNDVWVAQKFNPVLADLQVRDPVEFQIKENRKGQPQALGLRLSKDPDLIDVRHSENDTAHKGTIKSFDTDKGYGFISCVAVNETHGRDVFLHSKQVKSFKVGDSVTFLIRINDQGQPQAYRLREAPKTVAWLELGGEPVPSDPEYSGVVKSFNDAHGYGFIDCPETHAKFGRDVFIHQSRFEEIGVGDRVSFKVQEKDGQPRARNVTLQEKGSGAPTDANGKPIPKIPPELLELEPEVLDRRLLRQCASARAESVESMADLLNASANPNCRDVTEQTPLMIAALNDRHGEKKCKLLIDRRADPGAMANERLTVLQWTRERINANFASYLGALHRGEEVDVTVSWDRPPGDEF